MVTSNPTYAGLCVGGPWDGQAYTGLMRREGLFELKYLQPGEEADRREPPVVYGTYVYNSDGTFVWEPLESGRVQ